MLAVRLGGERIAAEPAAVEEMVTRCARLPLALALVAARAAAHPEFPLDALAAEMRERPDSLDPFVDGDPSTDVRRVFSWSYSRLSPDAARLFRLLGMHPGPDVALTAAASMAGEPVSAIRPAAV